MIAILIAWFLKDPVRIAGTAAIAALIALSGYLKIELVANGHAFAVLQKASDAQSADIGRLKQSLAAGTEALNQYAKLGALAAAEQAAANARASAAAVASAKAIAKLRAVVVPKDCAGASEWAAGAAKNISAGWDK